MAGKIVIDIEDLATQTLEGLDETLKQLQSDAAAPLEQALGEVEHAQNAVAESAEQLTGQVTEISGEVEELAEQFDALQDGMGKAEKSTGGMVSGLSEVEKAATKAGQNVKQFGAEHTRQAADAGTKFTAMGRYAGGFAQSVAVMVASNENDLQKMMQSIIRVRATFQMFDDGLNAVKNLAEGIKMLQQTKQNLAAITPAVVAANQAHAASNVAVTTTSVTATGAVKALAAAMLANPVTAVLVGIAAATTAVVGALALFRSRTQDADEQQRKLAESTRLGEERLKGYAKAIAEARRAGADLRETIRGRIEHEERLLELSRQALPVLREQVALLDRQVSLAAVSVVDKQEQLRREQEMLAAVDARLEKERENQALERDTSWSRYQWGAEYEEQQRRIGVSIEKLLTRREQIQARINQLEGESTDAAQAREREEAALEAAKRRILTAERELVAFDDARQRAADIQLVGQTESLAVINQAIAAHKEEIALVREHYHTDSERFRAAYQYMDALHSQRERLTAAEEQAAEREREEFARVRDAMAAMRGDFEDFAAERLRQQEERARQEELARAVEGERLDELHAKEQERLKASKDLQKELARQQQELRQLKQATGDAKDIEERRKEVAERIKQTKAGIVEQDRQALEYQRAQEKIEQDRQRRAEQEAQKRQAALTREIQQRQILQQLAAQVERKDVAKQIAQQRIAAGDMPDRIAGMGGAQQERAMMQMVMAQLKKGAVPQEEIARAQMSAIEQGARQIGLNEEQLKAFREAVGMEQQQFRELQMIREALEPLGEWVRGERRPVPGRAQAGPQRAAGAEGVPMADPQAAVRGAGEAFQREIEQRARLADATGRMVDQQVGYAEQSGRLFNQTASLISGANGLLAQHATRLQRLETVLAEQSRSQRRTAQIAGRV